MSLEKSLPLEIKIEWIKTRYSCQIRYDDQQNESLDRRSYNYMLYHVMNFNFYKIKTFR